MSDLHLALEEVSSPEDEHAVHHGLLAYNVRAAGDPEYRKLHLFLRDRHGGVAGGLLGATYWGWLFVDVLWVDERFRGQGHGAALLRAAEEEAVLRGCPRVLLDTFDWQARPFYERHGYTVFGTLDDFPPGHARFYMRKDITK